MLNPIQITLLLLVALAGIPAGFFVAKHTKEELKPGKKWFKIIVAASVIVMFVSLGVLKDSSLALAFTVSFFTFFVSAVPLYLTRKKK